ncbi:Rox3 mediator complex subunit-domain-containing protein [Pyronema omphalodes]|nr:Rox3 mediator complex subunit-domain-containing protein [Pyronema omphalodes]
MDNNIYSQSIPDSLTPRQTQTATPNSNPAAPNSTHEDSFMDDYVDSNPLKRRRTDGSFDAERRPAPPNRPSARNDSDRASPSMQQIQELISNPSCPPYRLVCSQSHEKAYPDPEENLLQLYNLNAVVDKVARYDPVTKRKNKLRKSYKGFIGGISGRHEVVAKPSKPDQQQFFDNTDLVENKLQWLSFYPEDEWRNSCVLGKELSRGLDLGKLKRGLSGITKGDIPGFDASVLGLEDEPPKKRGDAPRPSPSVGTNHQTNGPTTAAASTVSASGGINGNLNRPKRLEKRRLYGDKHYEGYGELDDEGDDSGWDAERKKKKKRKKAGPDECRRPWTGHLSFAYTNISQDVDSPVNGIAITSVNRHSIASGVAYR